MATSKRAPENFYLDNSEDEEVYGKSDSTTIDDSYLANLGERMSESKEPPPAAATSAAEEPGSMAPSLPPSFAPDFEADISNPLRVDPAPMSGPAGGSSDDIIELGDDALEPVSSEFEASQHPSQVPSQHPSQHPSQVPPGPDGDLAPQGPSDLLRTVPPPPEEVEPLDPELDPATYDAPTFVRPSLIEQDPVPVLEIIQGNEGGRSYRFEKDAITVGRSLDNDIVLTDIAVSRRHTRLTRQSNNVFLEDMGSGNGTIVNGVKVPRSPVASSDRIEVGNTIFRIVFPGQDSFPPNAPAMDAAPQPQGGALHAKSTAFLADGSEVLDQIGVAQGQPVAPQTLDAQGTPSSVEVAVQQPQQQPRPQPEAQPAPRKSSPKSFKLAMAILAVGMLVIGCVAIIAAFIHVQNRGGGEGELGSDGLFAQGTKAYTERRWGQAADSFERVLALSPANTKAREYLNQSRAEERNQGTLEAARQALEEENFEDAVTTLRTIPRSSVYSPQAIELRADAEERQARALVAEARRLATDDPESARARIDRALALAPSNADALALRRQLSGGAPASPTPAPTTPATPPPTASPPATTPPASTGGGRTTGGKTGGRGRRPTPAPPTTTRPKRGSSGAITGILSQYKSGNFAGAADRARELAASGSSDQERQRARSLSRQIDRFAKAYRGGQSGTNSRQKMRHLEQAMRLDKQISGGHYAGKIRPTLRDVYVGNAQRAWRAGQYASACQSALRALKIDRSASGASQVSQRCESKAREFYQQGESARSSNLTQAKSYWRKVLNMVPRSNPWYTKAYSALNNAGRRRTQDEDE